MPLGIKVFVQGIFLCAGRIVWDHGQSALRRNEIAQAVTVVGGVGHDDIGGKPFDQGFGLRRIALLARRQMKANRASKTAHRQVNFGAQAAARAAKGMIFSPFFAPAAC